MKASKNKGFTMVELLGVIVIIGILSLIGIGGVSRLINKTKNTSDEALSKTLESAAKSYMQSNKDKSPRQIGKVYEVKARDLKDSKFLTEDLVNSKDENCMQNSYVQVYKSSSSEYVYSPHLLCGSTVKETRVKENDIVMTMKFIGVPQGSTQGVDFSNAGFELTLDAPTSSNKVAIDSYSYTISVKDSENNIHEVYNSGSLSGNKDTKITVNKLFKEYVDPSSANDFVIDVVAINNYGDITTKQFTSGYNDNDAPKCVYVNNFATKEPKTDADDWINKDNYMDPKKNNKNGRTITVGCDDGTGSGCKRKKFSKTWPNKNNPKGAEFGLIEIYDNKNLKLDDNSENGNRGIDTRDFLGHKNQKDCLVRVNVDLETPSAKLTATNGSSTVLTTNLKDKGIKEVNTIDDIGISDYSRHSGNEYWMNRSNYPNGVTYNISVTDNIRLDRWTWETNGENRTYRSTSVSTSNADGKKGDLSGTSGNIDISFVKEGKRYGVLTIYDKAGNKTIYRISANLDRTNPTCGDIVGEPSSYDWTTSSRRISIGCSDSMSGCSSQSRYFSNSSTWYTSSMSVTDNADNTRSCGSVNVYVDSCDDYRKDSLEDSNCGSCSTTCGSGTKYCRYTYSTKSNISGLSCGSTTSSGNESCYSSSGCCTDTNVSYGRWSGCSKSCGGGTQSRTVTYTSKKDGRSCGSHSESRNCNTQACKPKTPTTLEKYGRNNCNIRGSRIRNAGYTYSCQCGKKHNRGYKHYCTDGNGNIQTKQTNRNLVTYDWVCPDRPDPKYAIYND